MSIVSHSCSPTNMFRNTSCYSLTSIQIDVQAINCLQPQNEVVARRKQQGIRERRVSHKLPVHKRHPMSHKKKKRVSELHHCASHTLQPQITATGRLSVITASLCTSSSPYRRRIARSDTYACSFVQLAEACCKCLAKPTRQHAIQATNGHT